MTDDAFVLPVDKPEGPTSHDVVARARRALDIRKIGHTGTLDPFASGLLVLCVGRATRLAEYLTGLPKSYVAEARLGVETDSLDREGLVVAETDGWQDLGRDEIEAAAAALVGEIEQVPPQFSAKKVGGEAMHRKARRGETVELPPVPVTVHALEVRDVDPPLVTFTVRCSSGTYVRALARDLGRRLGVGAHLTGLRRTSVGGLDVERAVSLDALDDAEAVAAARLTPVEALAHLSRVEVDADAARRIRHGQPIAHGRPIGDGPALRRGQALSHGETGDGDTGDRETGDGGAGGPGHTARGPDDGGEQPVLVTQGDELVAVAYVEGGALKPRKVFPA